MFKQFDFKVLGSVVIIGALLIAGTHFFSQRSYKRFVSEIGVTPQSKTSSEPIAEGGTITPSEQAKPTQSTESLTENVEIESKSIDETDVKETPEFDASSLLSKFGMPEEVTSLLDEDVQEEDFEKAQKHFTETYGESSKVAAIVDKLKQMSGGPVNLDDLTALFEAWIEILPEEQQENRGQLMNVLALLNQVKTQGGSGSVQVIVDPAQYPTLIGDEDRVIIQNVEVETVITDE